MSSLRVDSILSEDNAQSVAFTKSLTATGVLTATSFAGAGDGITGILTSGAAASSQTVNGTVIFAGDAKVGGALTITGNLKVDGTQTIVNTETLDVADKTVGIASTTNATNTTADGAGIEVYASSSTANNNKTITWENESNAWTFSHQQRVKGINETVAAATTYTDSVGSVVVELDVEAATTYTYTIPAVSASGYGANIGIVSFKNVPADAQSGQTITLITTQGAAHGGATGYGNTVATNGIGLTCTVIPKASGSAVAGISTRGWCGGGTGAASTVTLSPAIGNRDFVSFFVHYTGGTNTDLNSYKIYVTKNGGFNQGLHGK